MGVVIYDKRFTNYIPPEREELCETCSHFPDTIRTKLGDAAPCVEVGHFVQGKDKACLKWTDEVVE